MYPHENDLPQYAEKNYREATEKIALKARNMAAAAPGIDRRIYEEFIRSRYFELLGYAEGLQDGLCLSSDWYSWALNFATRWLESNLSKMKKTESI